MTTIHCPACGEDFDYDGDLYLSPDDFRGIEIECPECGMEIITGFGQVMLVGDFTLTDYKIEGGEMTKEERDKMLKPFNAVIQICPRCGKLDVYRNDGHFCSSEFQRLKEEREDQEYKEQLVK